MAHYAFLNDLNIVTEVITGKDETETIDGLTPEQWYGNFRNQICKRTSLNTRGGVHANEGTPFRKNYASIGYTYDYLRDAFYPPKPFPSWTLNEETCFWEAPVDYPADEKIYKWNEESISWIEVSA